MFHVYVDRPGEAQRATEFPGQIKLFPAIVQTGVVPVVTSLVDVLVQPLMFFAITVYDPAAIAFRHLVVSPVFQEYETRPAVGHNEVTSPGHQTFFPVIVIEVESAFVTAFCAVAEQPCPSVIVTMYVPTGKPVARGVTCTGTVFHENVYGAEPPETATLAVPVLESQRVVEVVINPVNLAGAGAINANEVATHPFESLTE